MRFTVVVNTYNREPSLRQTLAGLRRQTHEDFEVVVVNGPSTDDTAALLEATEDVRALSCPATNLSRSRNIGIAAAAGEIVAFIDDDAIPESGWLSGLDAAYDGPSVVGAGGLVFDHTGVDLQYRYSACDRVGQARFDIHRPLDRFVVPGADPFLYLQGTNMSFRRSALVDIGGFDDDIEYMYDEAEVCLRLIDSGGRLVIVDGAAVHHRYLPSHLRNARRINVRPFLPMRNRAYFALQYGRPGRTTLDVIRTVIDHGDQLKQNARDAVARGDLSDAEAASIVEQVDAGIEAGIVRGLDGTRVVTPLPPAEPAGFRPFTTLRPEEGRRRFCLLAREYPPDGLSDVARGAADLVTGLASEGHEVHVMTASSDTSRVDFEDGVWVHRLLDTTDLELDRDPVSGTAPLLEPPDDATCLLRSLRRVWTKPPRDFVDGVHRLLTGAPPHAAGQAGAIGGLDGRRSREVLVRHVADSEEAKLHLGELRWLDRLENMVDEVRVARLQALWAAPPETFVAGVFDTVTGRPGTRWEWLAAMGGLAAGRSRLLTLQDVAGTLGADAKAGWLPVVERRAATAACTAPAVALRSALEGGDEAFVDALYRVVLRRLPEPDGRTRMIARLREGTPRGALIHDVAASDEVVDRRLDTGFLLGVEGPRPPASQSWKRPAGLLGTAFESALDDVRRGPVDCGAAASSPRA